MNPTTLLNIRTQCPVWLWALLPLLLAAALTIPLLNDDAFHHDEAYSMLAAGVLRPGPNSLADVWSATAERSSEQALGWPMLLSVWGHAVGWSEFAARVIPLFAGVLTLALVFRTGNDFLASPAGLIAALLLLGSAFFMTYFSIARAFTLVALFAALCLRCYWRIALHPRPGGRAARAGLLLGSISLLYAHYFGALLLPVLGLFHLIFVPKHRRWWQPVFIFALAALIAALQLPVLLMGLHRTVSNEGLHSDAMRAADVLERLLRYMSNGLLDPAPPVGATLTILLPLALLLATLLHLRSGKRAGATWPLVFTSAALLILVLAINEVLRVMHVSRMRYLIALWPLTALLVAAALQPLVNRRRRLLAGLLVLWLGLGVYISLGTSFRYEVDFLQRSDFHHVYRLMRERLPGADGLILDHEAGYLDRQHLYVQMLDVPYVLYIRHRDDPLKHVLRLHDAHSYLWLLFLTQDTARMEEMVDVLGRVECERAVENEWSITLARYARSPVHCPDSPARLQFDEDIQLTGPDIRLEDGMLRLHTGLRSADNYLLAHYSLAVHIIDPGSGQRVAQGDEGVGPGDFVTLRSEIDVSALPPGDYEVRVALYDWQSGARLPARDLVTGASGDMHTLHSFRIG